MDLKSYQREVANLEKEVKSLSNARMDNDMMDSDKLTVTSRVMKYKNYFIITVSSFLFLLLVKPKFVLKIEIIDEIPEIRVNKSKLIIWWIVITILLSLIYTVYVKVKKGNEN